jgi:hypothetical protein
MRKCNDEIYQLAKDSASSITNTDRHDISEILLKVVLNTINQIIYIK